jgi:general secretion pathway protein F
MTQFWFRAVTADDRPRSGMVEASNATDAARQLIDQGLYPLDVTANARGLVAMLSTPIGSGSFTAAETAQVLADLGQLVDAGVEVATALHIMASTAPSRRVRESLEQLVSRVRTGETLADAMSTSPARFPAHVIAVVRAGEVSGTLASGLVRVAAALVRAAKLRAQVITALVYPAFIVVAVLIALLVLVGVVIPALENITAGSGRRLPWQTQLLVSFAHLIRDYAWLHILALAALLTASVLALRTDRVRRRAERVLLRVPGLGAFFAATETARVSAMLALLTSAGLPAARSVVFAQASARLLLTREAFSFAASRLREGARLHEALDRVPTMGPRVLALVRIGEMTGRLSPLLEEAARDAEHQVTTITTRGLALLTPTLTLVLGAVAGFVLYAVMTAILSVNTVVTRTL